MYKYLEQIEVENFNGGVISTNLPGKQIAIRPTTTLDINIDSGTVLLQELFATLKTYPRRTRLEDVLYEVVVAHPLWANADSPIPVEIRDEGDYLLIR